MPVYRTALIFGFFAIIITVSIYIFGKDSKSFDQDCYSRLNLVERYYQTGDWYDNTLPRDNPQHPETTQWSRLLDIFILGGGWILGQFIGMKAGIFWWGALASPLFLVMGCLAIVWAGKPILADRERILSGLFYILQPSIVTYSMFARPDHHALLILLMVLSLGGMIKLLTESKLNPSTAILAALSQSLAMTISIEALVSTALSYLILGILWLRNTPDISRKAAWYSAGIAIWSGLLYVIHVPPQRWNTGELDRVSLAHLAVFLAVFIFWLLVARFPVRKKILTGLIGGICTVAIAEILNPKFIFGPTANIDPFLIKIWFSHIQEYHHLYTPWTDFPSQLVLWLFPSLFAIPWCIYKIRTVNAEQRPAWIYLFAACIVFALLTIAQVRWALYAEAVALIPLVNLIFFIMDKLCALVREKFYPVARCTVILCFAIGNLPIGLLLTPANSPTKKERISVNHVPELCQWLNSQPLANSTQIIAANCNFGAEIVYRTPFSVIATGSHRNADGIIYMHRLFTNQDPASVYTQLTDKQITLILITANSADAPETPLPEKSFYNLLKTGQYPSWIKPIPLPDNLAKNFILFQFVRQT